MNKALLLAILAASACTPANDYNGDGTTIPPLSVVGDDDAVANLHVVEVTLADPTQTPPALDVDDHHETAPGTFVDTPATFPGDVLSEPSSLVIDGDGALHFASPTSDGSGVYATNAGGSWTTTRLPAVESVFFALAGGTPSFAGYSLAQQSPTAELYQPLTITACN